MPYAFDSGAAVVYNNRIHILGGQQGGYSVYYNHYSIGSGEDEWTNEGILPYPFGYGCAVVYDGAIHLLGGGPQKRAHYWWKNESDYGGEDDELPIDISHECDALVYGNKIHIFGEDDNPSTKHYSWDGVQWIEEDPLPYQFFKGSAVVYHNRIHVIGGRYPSSYDPEWERHENHYALGYEYSNISKIQRGWLPVSNGIITKYVKTSDTDFNPKKVYYKLVDDEYVRVNPEQESWSSDYYEYHPIKNYTPKAIRGAWTKYNGQIKKVLSAEPLYYRGKLRIPGVARYDGVVIGVVKANDTFYIVYNPDNRGYDGFAYRSYTLLDDDRNTWRQEDIFRTTAASWIRAHSGGIAIKTGICFTSCWINDGGYFRTVYYSPSTHSFTVRTPSCYNLRGERIINPTFDRNYCYGMASLNSRTYIFGGISDYSNYVWRDQRTSWDFDVLNIRVPFNNNNQSYFFVNTYGDNIHLIGGGKGDNTGVYYTFDGSRFTKKSEKVPKGFRIAGIKNGIVYALMSSSRENYYDLYRYEEDIDEWVLRDEELNFKNGTPIDMQLVGDNFHIFSIQDNRDGDYVDVHRHVTNLDNVFN